jgi:hypothetical protein
MSWAVVIGVGGTIVGGVIASEGAKDAAKTAAKGGDAASAEAARQFDTIRGDNLGRINIGNQAMNALGGIYGYSPTVGSPYQTNPAASGATPFNAPAVKDGPLNSGAGAILNPYTITSKLGDARYVLDPAGKLFGNLFSGHGDEKRNLRAFTGENQIYDLGNGMLALADGTQFRQDQLQDVAGAWYGATYAPDGDQAGWQQKYGALIQKPQANVGQAGGGLTSDGVNQGMSVGGTPTSMSAPDYSAFFKSPDYQFRKDEGMAGIGNAFSASGGAKSGNALKALAEFNSNLAAGEFGNYFNRQAAIAGIGQTATNTSANAGIATGQIVGNALQNSADARASGVAGSANAIGAGLSGLAQGFGYWNANRRPNALGADNWGYGVPRGSYA